MRYCGTAAVSQAVSKVLNFHYNQIKDLAHEAMIIVSHFNKWRIEWHYHYMIIGKNKQKKQKTNMAHM